MLWGDKPYHSLDYELKKRFGEKVYRLSLNGGMTCPNRDGTLGRRGCIFCSEGGSGDFAGAAAQSISQQIEAQKQLLNKKRPVRKYIAYFQAYTNTYAPVNYLEKIFTEALSRPEVAVLSIATRPDCLPEEVLALLERLNRQKPVWVELGLQTMHENTAAFIRRGYPLPCFENAVGQLRSRGLEVIVHTILGLPGEEEKQMLQTMEYLNRQDIQGIKLQLLHILKHTDLASWYEQHPFPVLTMDEYVQLLIHCLEILSPELTIHRLTGDGPKDLLIAPLWSQAKRTVLNTLHQELRRQNTWQGRLYRKEQVYVGNQYPIQADRSVHAQ
ncbi:MAG: TIGR01212 family radical SAM protein [Lachnospiraceae bacterium]|nr:TIGR01212 family radical SAM protein [Lachnospiraceae bacterium]